MTDIVLQMRECCFGYRVGSDLFTSLNLDIKRGENVAIIGRNGAGKTTLLHLFIGLKRVRSGSILINGAPVGYSRKDLVSWRQRVAIVFQNPDDQVFAPTVEQDVSFGPMNLGLSDDQIEQRVSNSLSAMSLEEYRVRSPLYLSGGEKKRVAIAGALAMNPEILLLDEPTSGLDDESRQSLNNALAELKRKGVTIIASMHDLNFAWQWADRIIILSDGRVTADAAARGLLMNRNELESAGLNQPLLAELSTILGNDELALQDAAVPKRICQEIRHLVSKGS